MDIIQIYVTKRDGSTQNSEVNTSSYEIFYLTMTDIIMSKNIDFFS
jgi:hypothetical protein